ncbi:MAG: hypothetical protein ACYDA4_11145 [Ignavibacteriaceae bacterium]
MEENKIIQITYEEQVNKLLNEFMNDMYKGHDHIIARKYFHDLLNELIPKYFCICDHDKRDVESTVN